MRNTVQVSSYERPPKREPFFFEVTSDKIICVKHIDGFTLHAVVPVATE